MALTPDGRFRIALRSCAIWIATAIIAAGPVAAQSSRDEPSLLVVRVVTKDGDYPLAYSTWFVEGRSGISDPAGRFVIRGLPVGTPFTLSVQHLGYTGTTVTHTIRAAGTDSIRVTLARIVGTLPSVTVRGLPDCTAPGAPSAEKDPVFAAIFDQVRQNANQYHLLSSAYPFEEAFTWSHVVRRVSGAIVGEQLPTLTIDSRNPWGYGPGRLRAASDEKRATGAIPVIIPTGPLLGGARPRDAWSFWVPTLSQIADPLFFANHCFWYGGLEREGNISLIRVDFAAASRITTADVNGTFYLEPVTFQLRRSVMRLTKLPRGAPEVLAVEFATEFADAAPSIRLVSSIVVAQLFKPTTDQESMLTVFDTLRRASVRFVDGTPGDPVSARSATMASAAAPRPAADGSVAGVVVNQADGQPLAYSTVAVDGVARFTDGAGRFDIRDLSPGTPISIRARHLGYLEATMRSIVPSGRPTPLKIELTQASGALPAAAAREARECKTPGAPTVKNDSAFSVIVDQVRFNAEQYKLLSESYQFTQSFSSIRTGRKVSGATVNGETNANIFLSDEPWSYRISATYIPVREWMLGSAAAANTPLPAADKFGGYSFALPSLSTMADPQFFIEHCFSAGVLQQVDSASLLRVDFTASARSTAPGVSGSVFLEPSTMAVRRTEFRLTRIPKEIGGVTSVELTTVYGKALSSIPVPFGMLLTQRFGKAKESEALAQILDTIRLSSASFVAKRPGEQP